MIIQQALNHLQQAMHPVAKVLHKGEHGKVLAIVMKAGMELKEHEAHVNTTLVIVQGEVIYTDADGATQLNLFDEKMIAPNKPHRLKCLHDAVCILIQC